MDRSQGDGAVQAKLDHLRHKYTLLVNMDQSCNKARKMVIDTAKDLVARISEHERRLLNEIETFRETQRYKCHMTADQCHTLMEGLQERRNAACGIGVKLEPAEQMAARGKQSTTCDITNGLDENIGTEMKDSANVGRVDCFGGVDVNDWGEDMDDNSGDDIQQLVFCPVRCNTAFGSIDVMKQPERPPLLSSRQSRSLSVCCNRLLAVSSTDATEIARPRSSSIGNTSHELCQEYCQQNEDRTSEGSSQISASNSDIANSLILCKELSLSEQCLWKITQEGSRLGEVNCPTDVLFRADGTIVVSDRDNFRLQVITASGTPIKCVAEGQISPRRITLQQDGKVVVTDTRENCIKIVDLDRDVVSNLSKKKTKHSFKCPCGIAINSKGHFVISDLDRRNVVCYHRDRKTFKNLFSHGPPEVEFNSPSYIASDHRDRIIVSDNWCQSVYVFDRNGKLEFEISTTEARRERNLKYPNGVCVDDDDNIYVADWGNHSVSMFSSEGRFIRNVLTRRHGLSHPSGIAYRNDHIAVTEYSESHSSLALYKINTELEEPLGYPE